MSFLNCHCIQNTHIQNPSICNGLIFAFSYFCLINVCAIKKNSGMHLTVDIVSVFGSVLILWVSLSRFIMSSRFQSEPSTLFHMFLAGNVHEFRNAARHMIFNNKNISKTHKRKIQMKVVSGFQPHSVKQDIQYSLIWNF